MKICTKCKIEKELSEFSTQKNGKFGVTSVCKICFNKYAKKYSQENKEKILIKSKKYYQENKENKKKKRKERYQENKEKSEKYYEENKEKNKEKIKEYYQENKEKILIKSKKYYQENREMISEYRKKRYNTDINFKITSNLRTRFKLALKNNAKSGSAVKNLGCTIEEFKKYFESLFTEGMTWEKVFDGSIHIDHKRPLASFDLSKPEEQTKACHYTNLQPLWAVDNLKKSDKWDG